MRSSSGLRIAAASSNSSRMLCGSATPEFSRIILQGHPCGEVGGWRHNHQLGFGDELSLKTWMSDEATYESRALLHRTRRLQMIQRCVAEVGDGG